MDGNTPVDTTLTNTQTSASHISNPTGTRQEGSMSNGAPSELPTAVIRHTDTFPLRKARSDSRGQLGGADSKSKPFQVTRDQPRAASSSAIRNSDSRKPDLRRHTSEGAGTRQHSNLSHVSGQTSGVESVRNFRKSFRRTKREVRGARDKAYGRVGKYLFRFLPSSFFHGSSQLKGSSHGASKGRRDVKVNFPKIPDAPHKTFHKRSASISSASSLYSSRTGRRQSIVERFQDPFPGNLVRTAKYTPISFIPVNLFEQFRKFANVFFLMLVVIQFFPQIKTVDPTVAGAPVVMIVALTAFKDGFEDWKRQQLDRQVNSRLALVLQGGGYKNTNHDDDDVKRDTFQQRIRSWGGVMRKTSHWILDWFPGSREHPGGSAVSKNPAVPQIRVTDTPNPSGALPVIPATSEGALSSRPEGRGPTSLGLGLPTISRRITGSIEPISAFLTRRQGASSSTRNQSASEPMMDERPCDPVSAAPLRASLHKVNAAKDDPVWVETKWQDIRVGDVVYLRDNEFIPADMAILSTSEPDGLCFVETKNLDGETNLKVRKCVSTDLTHLRSAKDFAENLHCKVSTESPNNNLYSLNATMEIHVSSTQKISPGSRWPTRDDTKIRRSDVFRRLSVESQRLSKPSSTPMLTASPSDFSYKKKFAPISIDSMLLRGAVLRNTEYAIGLVLYTGPDTKLSMNSGPTPLKRSLVDRKMNPQVGWNLALLFFICGLVAVGHGLWNRTLGPLRPPYLLTSAKQTEGTLRSTEFWYEAFLATWTGLNTFQNLVPISLYLTIEIVKMAHSYFIWRDVRLYYGKLDQPALAKSWNLADDLGQIQYIFSDKTGTLTRNVMELRKCSIGPRVYGDDDIETVKIPTRLLERVQETRNRSAYVRPLGQREENKAAGTSQPASHMHDPTLYLDFSRNGRQMRLIREFFRALSLCHTVLVNEEEGTDGTKTITYRAQSPDEAALVEASKDLGFAFITRQNTDIVIDVLGEEERYELLGVIEFNSDRKRMSVIVRSYETGEITLYCKGADSVILERLTQEYVALPEDGGGALNWSLNTRSLLANGVSTTVGSNPMPRSFSPPPETSGGAGATRLVVERHVAGTGTSMHGYMESLSPGGPSSGTSAPPKASSVPSPSVDAKRESIVEELGRKRIPDWRKLTTQFLENFADEGLRTLCIASRTLSKQEFEQWSRLNDEASRALENRERRVDTVSSLIEKDLTLIGSTAIEDKLQEGVPESLRMLRMSGIKIWVLTGDKVETAISIGYSCNLITPDMTLIVIKSGTGTRYPSQSKRGPKNDVERQLVDALTTFTDYKPEDSVGKDDDEDAPPYINGKRLRDVQSSDQRKRLALVLDGEALKLALKDSAKHWLLELGCRCQAVLCCRVSPLQKAQVVELVRGNLKAMTLAIGDGANDVSMIQAAQIGVGIAGEEGLQAVTASDYAIGQFRFLQRLLFVHGRWAYSRTSEMIYNFFFKNIIWVLVIFWFQIFCGFSTETVYDFSYMLLFNVVFTGAPVIVMGVFDKDVHSEYAENVPFLYKSGLNRTLHTKRRFIWYVVEGLYQSLICYFVPLSAYVASDGSASSVNMMGYSPATLEVGTTMAVAAIANANIFVGVNLFEWNIWCQCGIWISTLAMPLWVLLSSFFPVSSTFGLYQILFGSVYFYLSVLACIILCQLPRVCVLYLFHNYGPSDAQIIREIQGGHGKLYEPGILCSLGNHMAGDTAEITEIDLDPDMLSDISSEDESSSVAEDSGDVGSRLAVGESQSSNAFGRVKDILKKTHSASTANLRRLQATRPRVRRTITYMLRGRAHQTPFLGYSFSHDETRGLRTLLMGQALPAPGGSRAIPKSKSALTALRDKFMKSPTNGEENGNSTVRRPKGLVGHRSSGSSPGTESPGSMSESSVHLGTPVVNRLTTDDQYFVHESRTSASVQEPEDAEGQDLRPLSSRRLSSNPNDP